MKKDEKLPITLCVITCNSEDRIKDMILKNKEVVSEVLVVVQESKDDTAARAREAGAVVIERRRKGTSDPDRNWLFALANTPWVLYLDDDEYISPELKENIESLIKENVDIYWLKRTNLVDGVDIFKILGHDMQPRLFRKGALNFPDQIHTYPSPASEAMPAFVEYPIIHERTLEQVKKGNRVRNNGADPRMIEMQEKFIMNVEALLDEVGNAV